MQTEATNISLTRPAKHVQGKEVPARLLGTRT
jgi:hypothetical protein